MNKASVFKHIDPCLATEPLRAHMQHLAQGESALGQLIFEAGEIAKAAIIFFRGVFPNESPYFWWGVGDELRWHEDYDLRYSQDQRQTTTVSAEINSIVAELRRVANLKWGVEPLGQLTYESLALCESEQLKVQSLLVEVLLCIDGFLERVLTGRLLQAMAWQAGAYKNLIEAIMQARILPQGGKNNSAAA